MATVEELKHAQNTALSATSSPAASTASEGENRVNAMFDAQKEAQLNQLETAYNQSMTAAQEAKDKIAPQYQSSANALSVEHERNKRNLNQQAAMNGINTGTGSQMALAQNSAYQRDAGALRKSEAEALTAADKNMADLTAKHKSSISQLIADNDYDRAVALFQQYKDDKQEALVKAEQLASFGNFSGYEGIYTPEEIASMKTGWAASNPQLALATGAITQSQYDNLIMGKPMNEGLDESGNRVAVASRVYNDPWAYGGGGWNPYSQLQIGGLAPADWLAENDDY